MTPVLTREAVARKPIKGALRDDELSDRARQAANQIIGEHHGAWGGVMLQREWMASVIADAFR